jgi:hypothetical protein
MVKAARIPGIILFTTTQRNCPQRPATQLALKLSFPAVCISLASSMNALFRVYREPGWLEDHLYGELNLPPIARGC